MDTYSRISQAIAFVQQHCQQQPSLADIAAHVHLSPAHFQRLFSEWAGVSPKKLLQVLTLEQAKQQLRHSPRHLQSLYEPETSISPPLSTVAEEAGLSTASRLYDHFVQLEAVTPGEFRSGGAGISFSCGHIDTPYGTLLAAISSRGIHQLRFVDDAESSAQSLQLLRSDWPLAQVIEDDTFVSKHLAGLVALMENRPAAFSKPLSLWVKGTNFQINVWRALLQLESGQVSSYRAIADSIGRPKASRAVGNAIGANPVALLIPCHRVLQQSGALGGYRWGSVRKQTILVREHALSSQGE